MLGEGLKMEDEEGNRSGGWDCLDVYILALRLPLGGVTLGTRHAKGAETVAKR